MELLHYTIVNNKFYLCSELKFMVKIYLLKHMQCVI